MQKQFIIVLLSCIPGYACAQNTAAYNDYRNFLYVFENGINRQVEYNKVKSFAVGGTMVAWVDYLENFKVYYKGETVTMERVPIKNLVTSDYLVAYVLGIGSELYVIDAGKQRLLTTIANYYTIGDSIVTFYDRQSQSYNAYYKGKVTELDYMEDTPKKDEKVSDNVAAFISRTGEFRVFWNGQVYPQVLYNGSITYQAGKNIVSFIDPFTTTLRAFYKGETYEVEKNKPLSFKTGDDLVAYETNDWTFNVFYDRKIIKLSSYQPKFYDVTDSLVIFQEFNAFKVFYKGKIHTLETNFIPPSYQADFSSIAYYDVQNRLTVFSNGEKKIVTYEPVSSFKLHRNAIHYLANNVNRVWWKGKSY